MFCKINTETIYIFSVEYINQWENPWLWLWLCSCLINSIYSYTWDLKMDWGLLDSNAGENRFLREEVVYSASVSKMYLTKKKVH